MVASEASKPIHHPGSQQQHSQEDSLSIVNIRNHHGAETTRHSADPPHRLEEIVHNAHEQSAKIVSEFEEIVNGGDLQPAGESESDAVVRRTKNKKFVPVDRTGRRMISRKKDILVERPAEAPDLKEVIFLETISKNAGVTNEGLQDIPGPPSVVTLVEHQNNEIQIESKLEENIEATLKNISHHLMDEPAVDTLEDDSQAPIEDIIIEKVSTHEIPVKTASEQAQHLEEKNR